MIFFAPDVEILRYLDATGQLTPEVRAKAEYFITDTRFRRQTFNVKRSPGWALILGDENQSELITRLKDKNFIIYSTFSHPNATFLGNRATSSIYFLQNQVRYAMIYGQMDQGDPHEMGHFLEADGPGILIVHGNLSEVESLLVLGYMITHLNPCMTLGLSLAG